MEFVEYITSSACSQPEALINVPNRIHKENKILLSEILLPNAFCFLNITVAEIIFYMLLLLILYIISQLKIMSGCSNEFISKTNTSQ